MRELTPCIVLELLAHEGLVPEAYRDSAGVWTWSVGITDASGHRVHPRYLDRPQPLEHCLGVFLWLLRTRYLPAVLAAFGAQDPAEHELGAALSFHWNTGAIGRAEWVACWRAGKRDAARDAFLSWCRPPEILARRRRECDLLLHAAWSGDGTTLLYEVAKPSYHPVRGRRVNVAKLVTGLLAAEDRPPVEPNSIPASQPRPSWFDRLFG